MRGAGGRAVSNEGEWASCVGDGLAYGDLVGLMGSGSCLIFFKPIEVSSSSSILCLLELREFSTSSQGGDWRLVDRPSVSSLRRRWR